MFSEDGFDLHEKINILQQALDAEKDLRNRLDIENQQLQTENRILREEIQRLRKEVGEREKWR
jgi:predicted  nucleic acid-binding Zn-ribbon protein